MSRTESYNTEIILLFHCYVYIKLYCQHSYNTCITAYHKTAIHKMVGGFTFNFVTPATIDNWFANSCNDIT